MMRVMEGDRTAAELAGGPSLATWLLRYPETHDYVEDDHGVKRLKFRAPWRLVKGSFIHNR